MADMATERAAGVAKATSRSRDLARSGRFGCWRPRSSPGRGRGGSTLRFLRAARRRLARTRKTLRRKFTIGAISGYDGIFQKPPCGARNPHVPKTRLVRGPGVARGRQGAEMTDVATERAAGVAKATSRSRDRARSGRFGFWRPRSSPGRGRGGSTLRFLCCARRLTHRT